MRITNGERELEVTEKAYNVVYRYKGYKPSNESENTSEKRTIDNLTVSELKEIAKEKEIEGYASMKKAELIEAIKG